MKNIKLFIATIVLFIGTAFCPNSPKHDYYLDVDRKGYILYDVQDNRKVSQWGWKENPKLDSIIDKDNQ